MQTIVENLPSSYRAYGFDFWGFGDSRKLSSQYSIEGYVEQLELFMNQMGIGRAPIVGHGLESIVAIHYAQINPKRVEVVMAVSTPMTIEDISDPLRSYDGVQSPAHALLGGQTLEGYEKVASEAYKTDLGAVMNSVRSVAVSACSKQR